MMQAAMPTNDKTTMAVMLEATITVFISANITN
jgi:hypothetical protein